MTTMTPRRVTRRFWERRLGERVPPACQLNVGLQIGHFVSEDIPPRDPTTEVRENWQALLLRNWNERRM